MMEQAGVRSDIQSVTPESLKFVRKTKCVFYGKGSCRNGSSCRFQHNSPDKETSCNNKKLPFPICQETTPQEPVACGICYDNIESFGLLNGCDHAFCIACISTWRKDAAKSNSMSETNSKRSCPLCREHSNFVIQSQQHYKGQDRINYIQNTLDHRNKIPCKQFAKDKACKFFGTKTN